MNKNDKRFIKTELNIKKAFVELCKCKEISKITITDICNYALINRCTFYLHYETIQDLINNVEDEYAMKLIECYKHYHYDKITDEFVDHLFQTILDNKDIFFYWLFLSNGKVNEINKEHLKNETIPIWLSKSKISEYEATLAFEYITNGGMAILKNWFLNDFKDLEETKQIFEKLIKFGLYSVVYK